MRKIIDIIHALKQGGELVYVAGRCGGYILTLNGVDYFPRDDYARKAIERMGLIGVLENRNMVYRAK